MAGLKRFLGFNDIEILWKHIVFVNLEPDSARQLAKLLIISRVKPTYLTTLLSNLDSRIAVSILTNAPSDILLQLPGTVWEICNTITKREMEKLIYSFIRKDNRRLLALAGRILALTGGKNWNNKTLKRVFKDLVAKKLGYQWVASLIRDWDVDVKVQVLALDALMEDRSLCALVVKWRFKDLFQPREIRLKLKEARMALMAPAAAADEENSEADPAGAEDMERGEK